MTAQGRAGKSPSDAVHRKQRERLTLPAAVSLHIKLAQVKPIASYAGPTKADTDPYGLRPQHSHEDAREVLRSIPEVLPKRRRLT